eukprot:20313-Eustigmatos_ZCMA.PRE.1
MHTCMHYRQGGLEGDHAHVLSDAERLRDSASSPSSARRSGWPTALRCTSALIRTCSYCVLRIISPSVILTTVLPPR